jgi:hypothetical protein
MVMLNDLRNEWRSLPKSERIDIIGGGIVIAFVVYGTLMLMVALG